MSWIVFVAMLSIGAAVAFLLGLSVMLTHLLLPRPRHYGFDPQRDDET